MQKIGPWYFPKGDTVCGPAAIQEVMQIEANWLPHVKGRDVAIQAGGNCGLFPSKLGAFFCAVYTAEPDVENFLCLNLNCCAENVYPFRAAFGDKAGTTGMHLVPGNPGGHWIEGKGTVPVVTIDSLNVPACDLIALDTEGSELLALRGAEATVERFKPTILVEDKGHVKRFGQTQADLHGWLESHGYHKIGMAWRDSIWVA